MAYYLINNKILSLLADNYLNCFHVINSADYIHGMINDLRISIPIKYYEPYISLDMRSQDIHQNYIFQPTLRRRYIKNFVFPLQ